MKDLKVGYAFCGSFCTLKQSFDVFEQLSKKVDITPIMSDIVYTTDTRFGLCEDFKNKAEMLSGKKIIHTIKQAEPIGPKSLFDILIIAPCTGNTLAKLALGITDSSVTMAAKAHLRNQKPLVIGIATNDALSASAKNIGTLLNTKNIYFVPIKQDDPENKATSLICDFSKIEQTAMLALKNEQIQPIYY